MKKHVLVPLADGVEEIEAVVVIDTLRRAGLDVTTAGISNRHVTASRGVGLVADAEWDSLNPTIFDAIVIPGGGSGTKVLLSTPSVLHAVRTLASTKRLVAAICAGPLVLQKAGVLHDRRATCHPGVVQDMKVPAFSEDRVVIDGNIVTSRGPGTAFEFALAIVKILTDSSKSTQLAAEMLVQQGPEST